MRDYLIRQTKSVETIGGLPVNIVNQLDDYWQQIGFTDDDVQDRLTQAQAYLNHFYARAIEEERDLIETYTATVSELCQEISKLMDELGEGPFRYTGPETLVQKVAQLKEQLARLKKSKDEKMVELFELKQIESELTTKLSQRPAMIAADKIPTPGDLEVIRENIKKLKMMRDERWHEFKTLKSEIGGHLKQMGESPKTLIERQVMSQADDSYFALDPDNLQEVRQFQQRLSNEKGQRETYKMELEEKIIAVSRRLQKTEGFVNKLTGGDLTTEWIKTLESNLQLLEEEKKTKLKGIILNMREELRNIWDKLYYTQEDRDRFEAAYVEEYTEQICTMHENEIRRLNAYFEMHSKMFNAMDQWQKMFAQYCEYRDKEKDPNRYKNNRGCRMAKELEEFNKLKKRLTKLENTLIKDTAVWESENDKNFMIYGNPLQDFIEEQWSVIADTDKQIRAERHRKKKEGLAIDMVYGTRTPTKRGNQYGSTRDLTKRSRLENTALSTVSRLTSRMTSRMQIPPFQGTPTKKKENVAPISAQTRRLRRKSKSAQNILDPTRSVTSRIKSTLSQFRTPQPIKRTKSKLPVPQTEKPKRTRPLAPVAENVPEPDKLTSFDDFDLEFAPTSIKSAPQNFCSDEPPMSYEEFGQKLRKENRSSAIGCIQLTSYGCYDM